MGACQSLSSWLPCRGLEWPSCCHQHWCLNVRSGVAKSYFHIIGRRRCIRTAHVAAFLALIGRLLGWMLRYVNWPRMYVLALDWRVGRNRCPISRQSETTGQPQLLSETAEAERANPT